MAAVDHLKEQIAYFRLWLGVLLVTMISLMGWLATQSAKSPHVLMIFAMISVVALSIALLFLHRAINTRIRRLKAE